MIIDFANAVISNRKASWRKLLPEHGTTGQPLIKLSDAEGDVGWGPPTLYGTGDPPPPEGLPEGTVYFQITP